jgi:hypothetical protein
MSGKICAECARRDDPVTPDNGVSVSDVPGQIVMVHNECVPDFLERQSKGTVG